MGDIVNLFAAKEPEDMTKEELLAYREELEARLDDRKIYQYQAGSTGIPVCEGSALLTAVAAPILSEGDLLGSVLLIGQEPLSVPGDAEYKLAQTIAAFLGRHMES